MVSGTLFDYVPPAAVRELALRKTGAAEIHDQCLSERNRRVHVLTPDFSLASQRLESVGGHSPPPYILLARYRARDRFAVPFLPDESFQHQPCAALDCLQTGTRVVGRLYYDLRRWRTNLKDADKMDQRDKFLADPTYVCEPRLLIGFRDQLQGVRIGNVDWGGAPVRLRSGQSVATSYGDLFLGVVVRLLDRGRDAGRPRLAGLRGGRPAAPASPSVRGPRPDPAGRAAGRSGIF